MTAIMTPPIPDIDVPYLSFAMEASPLRPPSGEVEEIIECKCKLAAFGRCPTQLTPRLA